MNKYCIPWLLQTTRCCWLLMVSLVVSGGLTACTVGAFAAEDSTSELPIDEVIATIREFESKVDCVQFECAGRLGAAVQTATGWQIERPSVNRSDCTVLWRPATGQFLVRTDSIDLAGTEGKTDAERNTFAGTHSEYSSDGVEYRSWYRIRLGTEIPAADSPASQVERTGLVCRSDDEVRRQQGYVLNAHQAGIGWVIPYVQPFSENRQKLSDLLSARKQELIRARVTAAGNWKIHYMAEKTSQRPHEMCIEYDPKFGRLVRCEAVKSGSVEYRWGDWKVYHAVDFTYEDDAAVIPKVVSQVVNLHSPPDAQMYQWTYSKQQLNPDVKESDFRTTFEKGVEVTDYLNEKAYVVGAGLEDDQKAITKFMQLQGLAVSAPSGPPPKTESKRHWILIANGVVLATLVVAWIVRRLRHRPKNAAMIFLAGTFLQGAVNADQSTSHHNNSVGSQIQTQQCGHLVTMLALELRGLEYDLDVLRLELTPNDEGVSLAQINDFSRHTAWKLKRGRSSQSPRSPMCAGMAISRSSPLSSRTVAGTI